MDINGWAEVSTRFEIRLTGMEECDLQALGYALSISERRDPGQGPIVEKLKTYIELILRDNNIKRDNW